MKSIYNSKYFLSGFSLMLSDMLLDVINLNIECLMIDCLYPHYIWLFIKAYSLSRNLIKNHFSSNLGVHQEAGG